jgi:glyoxylase-like metal-dependent hydrolase (beta-lactamase superfamily II)
MLPGHHHMKNDAMRLLKIFPGFLLLLYSFAGFSQNGHSKLEISHLTGNLYVYTTYHDYEGSPVPSNSMYVVTDDGVVMIDTPWDSTQFHPLLDSIEARHNKKVVMCVATHFHDDRTGGFDFLRSKGIQTWSSKKTLELCAKEHKPQAEFTFANDTTFNVGGLRFSTFYPGEGHSSDNIVVWFPHEKLLYGGCFVKSTDATNLGNTSDANLNEWANSVRAVIKEFPHPVYVIPGHNGWQSNASLKHTLKLLRLKDKK